jgi:CRP-like cAMP-binding protein
LLLTENLELTTRPPRLLERLSPEEGHMLLSIGQNRALRPGEVLFTQGLYGSSLHTWSAEALEPTRVTLLLPDKILALIPKMPQLALGLIEELVFKGQRYSALAQIRGTRSVTERLPILLRHLVNLCGVATENGILVTEPMTHEEIARMVGSTRQWVTTSLNRLQSERVIAMQSGKIVIRRTT